MIFNFIKHNYFIFLNLLIIFFLLLLPYYLFQGKFFLGGDDTRLFYVYPQEYLKNIPLYSWINLSSVGWNFSYQTFLPFILVWSFLAEVIKSKLILSYFSFSLPFILGFIFFQKLLSELIIEKGDAYKLQILSGALFYVFSPIIIHNHFLNPLIPIWLIGLIPASCFLFLRFLRTGKYKYILLTTIFITIFSFGAHNLPWLAGFVIPMMFSLFIGSFLYKKKDVLVFLKRLAVFFIFLLLSQSFWLYGFIMTFVDPSVNSFTSKAISQDVVSDFENSVRATSVGNILYPLLNLFHRQIAFDFQWNLKNIFTSFYDKTYFLNSIYIVILFLGIINYKKYTIRLERKIFIILLIAFLVSLYLFTVNIGPLLDLYILFGNIPGFVLFRNPFDKFALGYGLIYSMLITYCLVILSRRYLKVKKISVVISAGFLLAVFVGALTIKDIIVSPLWTTKNIYKNIEIPEEYLKFMDEINKSVSPTNNIFSLPYGLSLYTIIKDVDSDNVYVGVSPVVIFSGVNDISGYLSFNYAPEAKLVDEAIVKRNYDDLNNILYTHNINYIFLTKNVPNEVKNSFIFVQDVLKAQDKQFMTAITGQKVITSSEGNYELYTAKKRNSLISSNNLSFTKISRVKYKITIKNIKKRQELLFNDTFHEGWKVYLQPISDKITCKKPQEIRGLKTTECGPNTKIFEMDDVNYAWRDPIFSDSHGIKNGFSNKWVVDPDYIKSNFDKKFYRINKDGSIDVEMILYFKPQVYFYFGTAVSLLLILSLLLIVLKQNEK